MVAARESFLGAQHFLPLAQSIARTCLHHAPGARFLIEAGAGTGYHIAHVLAALPRSTGLALDLSKFAARRAARAHLRLDAVVADILETLPLKSESVDLALNIFAPRPASELHRILRPQGRLIVAFPAPHHMHEVRNAIDMLNIDPGKESRLARTLHSEFRLLDRQHIQWPMELQHHDLTAFVKMGPTARHIELSSLPGKIARLDSPLRATGAVNINVYERK